MKHKLALFLILAVAALLRFGGLSHDLHEGRVYHPDSLKQARAVERLLAGNDPGNTGVADGDGASRFHARLMESLCRIVNPPRVALLNLLGVPTRLETPDRLTLLWIMRLFNASLATGLVWLVYRMMREHHGTAAALVATLFVALSPVDVTACHYANGNTAAAFFATLALLFTLRMARHRRWRDGLPAVVFAACGLAARFPPDYPTLIPPLVSIPAALFLTRRPPQSARPFLRRALKVTAALAIVFSAGYLGRQALKETFFLWHMDTRRMADHWTAENVPPSFAMDHGPYTFQRHEPAGPPDGTVFVRGSIRPDDPPDRFQPLKSFALERASLTQFRNPDILAHIGASSWITSPTRMPVSQRWPSETGNHFVFDNGLTFLRDEKRIAVDSGCPVTRRLIAEEPLEDAFLTIRNGPCSNRVAVSFGGWSGTFQLAPGVTEPVRIRRPKPCFPRERGLYGYRLSASAASGPAMLRLATRNDEIGVALYDAGRHAEAASWLESAAVETRNPTLAVQALASRLLAPPSSVRRASAVNPADLASVAGLLRNVFNAASLEDTYGIGPRYLDALPFLSITNDAILRKGFTKHTPRQWDMEDEEGADVRIFEPDPAKKALFATRPLLLDPGYYTCAIRFRYQPLPEQKPLLAVVFSWPDGTAIASHTLDVGDCSPGSLAERRLKVYLPAEVPAAKVTITPESMAGLTVDRITLAPDILATVLGWKTLLALVNGGPAVDAAGEPMAFELLMALGDRAASTNATSQALEYYTAAGRSRPDNRLPASRLAALRQ